MPAKRKRTSISSDGSDFSTGSTSDSDFSVVVTAAALKASSSKRTLNPKKKAKTSTWLLVDGVEVNETRSHPHGKSRHTITDAAAMHEPLLQWFSGVKDARRMPWRKVYDASLDRDQRAQRAYEVRILTHRLRRPYCTGRKLRYL